MAYENGKTYWIVPQNNTSVALSVYGNTQVSQNRDVIVWNKQDIKDQLWRVDVSNGYARIKSRIDDAYALNVWLGSSNYGNCDIHTWSDNLEDSKVNFRTVDASQNLYLIQCYRNNADNNLYLTAESTSSGENVKWTGRNTGLNQVWKLIEKTGGDGAAEKQIVLPVLLSQKIHSDSWFQENGCAVTAGIMAAAYHDGINYNIHSFDGTAPSGKAYWTTSSGYVEWETPLGWSFVEDDKVYTYPSDAETVAYIKSIIDNGIPPICYCPTGTGHWMLAYGYTSGSTFDDILIVDPADGARKTLKKGIIYSCGNGGLSAGITRIRKAPSAH